MMTVQQFCEAKAISRPLAQGFAFYVRDKARREGEFKEKALENMFEDFAGRRVDGKALPKKGGNAAKANGPAPGNAEPQSAAEDPKDAPDEKAGAGGKSSGPRSPRA